jgi:hypothetical protein
MMGHWITIVLPLLALYVASFVWYSGNGKPMPQGEKDAALTEVRDRSRRDFLHFAIATSKAEMFVHKWAAIEKTHIFPVKPIVSLFMVRTLVGLAFFAVGSISFYLAT